MEIYAAPKLSKYMTALGAYNVKSFTYKLINEKITLTNFLVGKTFLTCFSFLHFASFASK